MQIVEQAPSANYWQRLMTIPKRLIKVLKGEKRLISLVFPGATDHAVKAYVSAVFGSYPSIKELEKAS